MRWLPVFVSSLFAAGSLAAKKSSADRIQEFHTKGLSANPVKLDDGLYRSITATPRDYSAAVLLTAMDARFGCQLCREFQPEWDLLARSWIKGDKGGASRIHNNTQNKTENRDTNMSVCQ